MLTGPDTCLRATLTVVADTVHNLLIRGSGTAIVIHNRTVVGNAKPRAVIEGLKTGMVKINQMQVYSPKGWIVATMPGGDGAEPEGVFVGIWRVNDNGNVAPRWKIEGPKSGLKRPRGVALNPMQREIYVADMCLNSVLTYYFPEIFQLWIRHGGSSRQKRNGTASRPGCPSNRRFASCGTTTPRPAPHRAATSLEAVGAALASGAAVPAPERQRDWCALECGLSSVSCIALGEQLLVQLHF